MIIKEMLKEEWRMHSEMFSGRSFASFPFMILLISLTGFWIIAEFSTLSVEAVLGGLTFLGVFLGLSVGSIGFSSSDAMKNVLGPTNFIVYASRTLPIGRRKLLLAFIVKDLIYYTALFLLPLALGAYLVTGGSALSGIAGMFGGFLVGLIAAVLLARVSMKFSGFHIGYSDSLPPLVSKTVLDISRSAGGFLKIIFSLAVLTGFYWFMVLYFPFTESFMRNPVLSFSVLIGVVSLTVYNWINRFDSLEDYLYLPVDREDLLRGKHLSFIVVAFPLTFSLLLISFYIYPASMLKAVLSVLTAFATQIFTLGLTSRLTGLKPNTRLFDTRIFLKYLVLNSVIILPLLALSVFFAPGFWHVYLAILLIALFSGIVLSR